MNPASNSPRFHGTESVGPRVSYARELWASVAAVAVLTALCSGVYPLVVWGLAQALFPMTANGSLVDKNGAFTTVPSAVVGSALLAQRFTAPEYFHPRPSAAGAGYDAANSSGSNLGPLSDKFINGLVQADDKGVERLAYDGVRLRTLRYATENGISFRASLPLEGFKDKDGNLDEVKLVKAFPHAGDPIGKTPLVFAAFSVVIPGDAVTASGSGLDPHVSPANAALQKARVAKARGIKDETLQALIDDHTDRPGLGILGDPGINVLLLNLTLDALHPLRR